MRVSVNGTFSRVTSIYSFPYHVVQVALMEASFCQALCWALKPAWSTTLALPPGPWCAGSGFAAGKYMLIITVVP